MPSRSCWTGAFPASKAAHGQSSTPGPRRRAFRGSLDGRRCVVPTSGFYEWQKPTKEKFLFRLPDADATYLAGIWNEFAGERRFCIVTTAANDSIADVHDRMPVVLPKASLGDWLSDRGAAEAILHTVPPMLTRQAVSAQTKLW